MKIRFVQMMMAAALVTASVASCSVKEDRTPCPAYLYVTYPDKVNYRGDVGVLGWSSELLFRATAPIDECEPYYMRAVKRGTFEVATYNGVRRAEPAGRTVTQAPGHEADSLYAYHERVGVNAFDEIWVETDFKKQFSTVHLQVLGEEVEGISLKDYRFLVESGWCGADVVNYGAVEGPFRCEPEVPEEGTEVAFRVYRQGDDGMTLTIWSTHFGVPRRIGKFPIGEYIQQTDFDWTAESLEDIWIRIDFALGVVDVFVDPWENGERFMLVKI